MASPKKKARSLTNIQLAASLSFVAVVISIVFLTKESVGISSGDLWGISHKRLAILLFLGIVGLSLLIAGVIASRKFHTLNRWYQTIPAKGRNLLKVIAGLLIVWGFVSLLVPDLFFGSLKGYFWLQRFLSLPAAFVLLMTWIMIWIEKRETAITSDLKALARPILVPFLFSSGLLLLLAIFIYLTRIGLVCHTGFWNVPGIPLSGVQMLAVLVFLVILLWTKSRFFQTKHEKTEKFIGILLPIMIYAAALLVWGFTPMFKHHFSLEQALPFFQPYPASDARVHDLGAISIIKGYGIFFHGFTDKPLYMVYLAILHLFANNDYALITWLQLLLLSLIPVVLFMIGKKYRDSIFGLALAAVMIIQQRNAILLSYKIASANVKLLITEELTLLGILLCVYLLLQWISTGRYSVAVLLGGLIGAMSLVRLNPLILVPLVLIIGIVKFRKSKVACIKHIVLFTAGFLLLFTPWLASGVDEHNVPWVITKVNFIINDRIKNNVEPPKPQDPPPQNPPPQGETSIIDSNGMRISAQTGTLPRFTNDEIFSSGINPPLNLKDEEEDRGKSFAFLFANHFLHNFSTSFLALPDAPIFVDLETIQQREYYRDLNRWDGYFRDSQLVRIILNLLLFSAGLAACWKKHRWGGLIPLFVFLTYDVSLGAAFNSGSRYIVPINWVIFFYYLYGIYALLASIFHLIHPVPVVQSEPVDSNQPKNPNHRIWVSFLPLLVVASLIPIANQVLPKLISTSEPQLSQEQISLISAEEGEDIQIWIGEILYPYYQIYGGSIMFDFLDGQSVSSYSIDRNFIIDANLTMGDQQAAALCFTMVDNKPQVKRVYLLVDGGWVLFWDKPNL